MKKKLARMTVALALIIAAALAMMFSLSDCGNYDVLDTNYDFDYAIISLPNGDIVEGEVETWRDFEDGDQIQVKIDGKIYLVHISDAVLIKN